MTIKNTSLKLDDNLNVTEFKGEVPSNFPCGVKCYCHESVALLDYKREGGERNFPLSVTLLATLRKNYFLRSSLKSNRQSSSRLHRLY